MGDHIVMEGIPNAKFVESGNEIPDIDMKTRYWLSRNDEGVESLSLEFEVNFNAYNSSEEIVQPFEQLQTC